MAKKLSVKRVWLCEHHLVHVSAVFEAPTNETAQRVTDTSMRETELLLYCYKTTIWVITRLGCAHLEFRPPRANCSNHTHLASSLTSATE